MLDIKQFASLQKLSSASFHQQKALIKRVIAGKKVNCEHCRQLLSITKSAAAKDDERLVICCVKGCTRIELDVA